MEKFNRTSLAIAVCLLPFSYSVQAETNPLTQELQRLKHQEAAEDAQKALEKADQFLTPTTEKQPQEQIVVDENLPKIDKISIDMLDIQANVDFQPIIHRYQGSNISSHQIFAISQAITEALYQAGYVTSAVGLKSKDLSDGHLQFIVYWGEVDQYLVNKKLPDTFKDKAMLSVLPSFKQNVFNVHQLDQFIEMMNTSNKSVQVDVKASEKEGKSNLNFVTSRRAWPILQLGYNTSGAENNANGRNQATLSVRMSDILGTNDEWSLSTGHRFYRQHSKNNQLNYSISYTQPFSFYTLETKLAKSSYEREVKGINDSYSSSGRTNTLNVKLSRMLFRNKESILSLYNELEFKKRINYIVQREVLNRHENKWSVGLSYTTNLLKGKLYSELTYANGLNWSGADSLAYSEKGDKTLRVVSGNMTWSRPIELFKRNTNYQLRIGAQYSPYHLYSDNQFSLGDEYTVRGFKGGIISGENGAYLSQTFSVPFYPQKYAISQITPLIGFDIGQVRHKSNLPRETISGFATGIKATISNRLSLALSYAKPLKDVKHNKNKSVYYFNGSVSF